MARKLTDEDLMNYARAERQRSIGFDHDYELTSQRIRGLDYFKGRMYDIPALENRSKAVTSDISDAILTVMPDLVEAFTVDQDDFAFEPIDDSDIEAAQLASCVVNQVVFKQNDGFLLLTTLLQDALLTKTGIARPIWCQPKDKVDEYEGKTEAEAVAILQNVELEKIDNVKGEIDPETGESTFSFKVTREIPGWVKVDVFPPEDFTVALDTVMLRDGTYCAARTRPRAQQLIADGYDAEKVRSLPNFGARANEEGTQYARDTVAETTRGMNAEGTGEPDDLRTVEIVEHILRVDADGDGQPEIHRIVTGGDETVLLDHEIIDRVYFSAAKPFLVTHRFYGLSLADLLIEIQRIKTALLRIHLDSGYFAVNQRAEINMQDATPDTLTDWLDATPGMPIRSKTGNAVKPIEMPGLGFNVLESLEYVSTMAESRTGVVRNAQGLNPDSLHDTASGAAMLANMAQKRVRLIAQMLAQTGLKDLFLNVYALLRKYGKPMRMMIRGQWVDINPATWPERNDMQVEIGAGASGREMQQAELAKIAPVIEKTVQAQGGTLNGPFVTQKNYYAFLQKVAQSTMLKGADAFFSDPAQAPPPPPAPPSPEMVKAQMDQQNQQDKAQREHEAEGVKMLLEHQKLAAQGENEQRKCLLETAKLQQQRELKEQELSQARELALLELNVKYATTIDAAQIKAAAEGARTLADLHQTDMAHQHETEMQMRDQHHAERLAAAAPEADDEPNAGLEDGE